MATVTSDILLLTTAGVKTEYNAAYVRAMEKPKWKDIATEIPTVLPIQKYGWLGRGGVMKLFQDEVEAQPVFEASYVLSDNIYKGNLPIDRRTLEDEQYGLLMMRVRELAQEPVRHWNQLAYSGLVLGFSNLCSDGQYFFNNSHQQGNSPTQNNTVSSSLSDAALETAETSMLAFVDDKGIPLEIMPDTLIVGPALARRAATLVDSETVVHFPGDGAIGSGATAYTPFTNYFKGKYKVIVNPYLINDSTTNAFHGINAAYYWFLADTSREIKPIVIQNREDVPITLETDMDQPSAKIKDLYQFTARGRYVQGYGLWQTCWGSNATS
jgi:phage major head subunit gpT-like protein